MTLDGELETLFRQAARAPLMAERSGHSLDVAGIEALLPHRPPLRLLDRVTALGREPPIICCRRLLAVTDPVFAGHFPGEPVYPGVLQVEAIGQAGILLHQLVFEPRDARAAITLTHVRAARFLRPLRPGDDIEIVARGFEDGLFFTVVGQCLIAGEVASAAVASAIL